MPSVRLLLSIAAPLPWLHPKSGNTTVYLKFHSQCPQVSHSHQKLALFQLIIHLSMKLDFLPQNQLHHDQHIPCLSQNFTQDEQSHTIFAARTVVGVTASPTTIPLAESLDKVWGLHELHHV